ncbi:diaminobutyrate--pyruvate aminotransferase [Streptomyces sp. Y2F8-2]|uniref:aspartate aminotransferase family protein n=1 Tax=Streptomyces sp. Y2F8-2 TaxID=2759675 RepID=UPI001A4C80FD|nr:aminotransferase class III-fold pyridoxal phosphate-dependent enzyme [Streptomyces sp. Y2F8-2]GHJ99324.1 diaminobutyrate--pyruvate aminotransferase [Streptomyces sp. Y2F8-2]
MNSASSETELAEPQMLDFLSFLGIDVEYVRGEGNTLYFIDGDNREVPVLDYAGGYGALVLGHNHPEILAAAREFLESGTPVLAQASRQPWAGRVATTLNRIIQREFGGEEPYYAVFSNSGAESVEVALKHAEFDRVMKVQALTAEITAHIDSARSAVGSGEATVPGSSLRAVGAQSGAGAAESFENLVTELVRRNAEQASRPPVFLTLEGSFHGKLVGSVQLTHNASYRHPFSAMAAQARFLPFEQPQAVAKLTEEERATVFDVAVEAGEVRVVERPFPVFAAFVLEVIQGEGGIRVVSEEMARAVQQACEAVDCPVVVDEIQSGMGRTGAFFASSLIGLKADYYTLAKGLGGGIAKAAVTLVRERRYRREFELVHSSTFAKDPFSTAIAHRTLEITESRDGEVYRLARAAGDRLLSLFASLREEFPDVIKDVRGKGLMLGLEFHDRSGSPAAGIRDAAASDILGYVISGHLFRVHRIRTFPTASAVNTLRFEPSVHLNEAEIDRLRTALRALCSVLRDDNEQALFGG